jgi:hypothetical protein
VEGDVTQGWQTLGRSTRDKRRKKTRPQRPLGETTKAVVRDQVESPRPVASGGGWRSTPARSALVGQTIRAEDYHYVYSDIRRIGVLAAGIFAVLIVVSFIIN